MSATLRCDNCLIVDSGEGWLELARRDVRLFDEPDAWHFCTFTCLSEWVAFRLEKGGEAKANRPV